jgi:hypothetical protein
MKLNWRAIGFGFLTALVLGLISGVAIPFTDAALPAIGSGLTAVVAGVVAGYVDSRTLGSGAIHGGIATTIGAILVAVIATIVGTLFGGVLGIGIGLASLVYIALLAIPGAFGGAVGSWLKSRSTRRKSEAGMGA